MQDNVYMTKQINNSEKKIRRSQLTSFCEILFNFRLTHPCTSYPDRGRPKLPPGGRHSGGRASLELRFLCEFAPVGVACLWLLSAGEVSLENGETGS